MKKKFEMSISESDKKLLIIFLAICLLAASYFFVFSKGMSKAQDIEDKNTKRTESYGASEQDSKRSGNTKRDRRA